MENKFSTNVKGYTFRYDGNNMVDVSRSWDDEDAQTITSFGIGKVDTQKKFEMEVGFWIIQNKFLENGI